MHVQISDTFAECLRLSLLFLVCNHCMSSSGGGIQILYLKVKVLNAEKMVPVTVILLNIISSDFYC